MKRNTLISAVALVAVLGGVGGAFAAGGGYGDQRGHDGDRMMGQRGIGPMGGVDFATADTDGDGKLTQEELDAAKAAWFAKIDADGSGGVSAEEFINWQESQRAERMKTMADQMIANRDTDADGTLSLEELTSRPQMSMIDRLDADGDGALSADEMQGRQALRGMMPREGHDRH